MVPHVYSTREHDVLCQVNIPVVLWPFLSSFEIRFDKP